MQNPKVTVGIVTWNSSKYLPSCLGALATQSERSIELVVVDNASTDSSLEVISSYFPSARIFRNQINMGFCAPHNQAIRSSHGEFYLPLNPDVTLSPQFISILIETINRSSDIGMVGGKLLQAGTEIPYPVIDSCGLFIDRKRRQYLRGFGERDFGQFDNEQEVFGIDGAAPLYRRKMLEDICIQNEFFDEAFFAHKEDVDLAWRSRLMGWRAKVNPNATAYHIRSFRPGTRDRVEFSTRLHAVKNRYLLLLKNEASQTWKRDCLRILWYDLKILSFLLMKERYSLKAIDLLRRDQIRIKLWRKEIWQRVKVPDSEIMTWFVDPKK